MITFSNKTIRENYLYEIEGVRISGDVDYNESTLWGIYEHPDWRN